MEAGAPGTTPDQAPPPEPELTPDPLAGISVAVLLVSIVVAERLGVARAAVDSVRDAHGGKETIATARPEWWVWLAVGLVGVGAAASVTIRLSEEIEGDAGRFWFLAIAAISTWTAWMALGLASAFGWDVPEPVHTVAHLAAIGLALGALSQVRGALGEPRKAGKRASVVRMQLIVMLALVALVFLVPLTAAQIADVLRAWGDGPYTRAANGVAAALLLGAVVRSSTYRFLAPEATDSPAARWRKGYTGALIAVVLVAAVLLAVAGAVLGLVVIALGLIVVRLTKWAAPKLADKEAMRGEKRLAATLGVVPLGIVVAGLAGAAFDSLLLPGGATKADIRLIAVTLVATALFAALVGGAQEKVTHCWEPARKWAFLLGLVAAFAACVLPREVPGDFDVLWTSAFLALAALLALRRIAGPDGAPLWAGAGAFLAVLIAVYLDPVGVPRGLGTFAVALIGTAGVVLVLHALGIGGARRAPRSNAGWLPDRAPVVALLGLWVVVAAVWPVDTFHQARTVSSRETRSLDSAVKAWMARQGKPENDYLPMVLISASGGGAKASYWTDLVVDCMLGTDSPTEKADYECAASGEDGNRHRRLFMTSSVSGGSVGVYHLLTQHENVVAGRPWVDRAGGREVLSPITAWGLFHDLPAFLLRAPTDPRKCTEELDCRLHADRALVQEAAVADFKEDIVPPGEGRHLIEGAPGPVPVFNAALDGADGRVLLSRLALAPPRPEDPGCEQVQRSDPDEPGAGSVDGHDVLRREGASRGADVPLVTAALLSARFPVVAPAARLGDSEREHRRCDTPLPLPPVTVRDGGYVENTGMLTLTDLLPQIRAAVDKHKPAGVHVQIVVVSIDDDSTVLDGDPRLQERKGPGLGIAQRVNDKYLSQLARDRVTSCQYPDVFYERISPPPHAGAQAATGWELSRTAREGDLRAALAAGKPALGKVERLRDILDGAERPRDCRR